MPEGRVREQHAARHVGGGGRVRGVERGVFGGGAEFCAAVGDGGVAEKDSAEDPRKS